MRKLLAQGPWLVLLVAAVATVGWLRGGTDPAVARIEALVQQLGDERFAQREAAGKELLAVGESALPALQQAINVSPQLEIRRRAQQANRAIMTAVRKSKSLGLDMAVIDAGDFDMGSVGAEPGRRADEEQHTVRLTTPFLLGTHEVTQAEYEQVMMARPSWFQAIGGGRDKVHGVVTGRFPVEQVTWYDAIEFCNLLSKQDGFTPYYKLEGVKRTPSADNKGPITEADVTIVGGNGYRLPTEAEWERACRAKSATLFHFGNATRAGVLNCKPLRMGGYGVTYKWPDLGRTSAAATYPPNDLGLFDMHGNVAEWCWDWYDKDYYARSPKSDPTGPERGHHRVLRGGSWLVSEESCRSASRFFLGPGERKDYAGFRVARTPGKS